MLAALYVNFVQANAATGGGFADDRLYYELLRQRRQRVIGKRKREFERAETHKREELARQAFEAVKKAKPELARQIVQPHAVYSDAAPKRYEVDWLRLVNDIYAYELLVRWQIEFEEEEVLLMLLAADLTNERR